jgi:hypothetical protein
MKSRRGFFATIFGLAAGGATAAAASSTEYTQRMREIVELQKAFNDLREQMERPITVSVKLDGRAIAEASVPHLPAALRAQGL